jgi:hypothetical protein
MAVTPAYQLTSEDQLLKMFVGDDKRLLKHLTGALSGTNCG